MKKLFANISIVLFFFSPSLIFAWNALGHMVIAKIAYQKLQPEARAIVDELTTYLHQEYPDMKSFQQMAYWPDAIRSQKIETFTHWHYIDYPFTKDGTALKNVIDTDNAIWALTTISNVVKNPRANTYERARFLAFLVHIVGDLHQPLHTVSYFSANYPDGDRGGNLYTIHYKNGNSNTINLHKLWDGGVGSLDANPTTENAAAITTNLLALYPESYFGNQKINNLKFTEWAQEGMRTAQLKVYTVNENQTPSNEYLNYGAQTAQQALALAGYRLANLLNQLLKEV